VDPLLHRYAIDGPGSAKVHQASGEVLEAPTLADRWTEFGAQAKASGEIDPVPVAGPVGAIVEGDPAGGVVALTIDDGPHPLTTPLTLETLRREGVKATFFLVGEKVEQYPELTRMIARDGHEIGNHTYSHIGLSQLNPRGIWTQLRGCERVLQQAVGVTPTLFRPPGGDCSELSLRVTSRLGYPTVLWTANAGDWARESREAIVANGLSHVRSGSIILIHQGDMWSLEALPYIIQGVRSAALRIGTVTEALGGAGPTQWEPSELLPLAKQAHTDRW
jgi:peptidoglycan/xylan/chitin deacetylase (PgdA/CDA1 family)